MKYDIEVDKNIEGQRVKVRIVCKGTGYPTQVSFTNDNITKMFILQLQRRNFNDDLSKLIDMFIGRFYK